MSLFWRVFLTNAAVFVVATAVLAFSPATVSSPLHEREALVLATGLAAILVANGFLLRLSFTPLDRLIHVMKRIDLLNREERLPASGTPEVAEVIEAFNEMLDRLEAERRASTARVLAGQEAERRRISHELHDEIGQGLTAVLLQLKRAASDASPEAEEQLAEAQATARATLDDVRSIAHRLRPGVLDDLGLVRALTALTNDFSERTGIAVERRFDGRLPELSREEELAVYRVAQESLTNVMRHAEASRVVVGLEGNEDEVLLRVADDGRGFHDGEVRGGGIRGMLERALTVRGRLSVGSSRLGGAEVVLRFPAGTDGG